MGRRSSKASHAAGGNPGFDTMGMNILPGVSMPEWAEPAQAAEPGVVEAGMPATEQEAAQALAAQQYAEQYAQEQARAQAAQAAQAQQAAAEQAAAFAAPNPPAAAQPVAEPTQHAAPEQAFAMAGMAMAGASMAGATAAAPPAPAAPPASAPQHSTDFGGLPPSRYPAAPSAGLAAPTNAPTAGGPAPGAAPAGPGAAPAAPAGPQMSAYSQPGYAPAGPAGAPSGPMGAPAHSMQAGAGSTQTLTAPAPTAPAAPAPGQPAAPPAPRSGETSTASTEATTQAPLPTETWRSPERPELSPEHVALLAWWADMIAAGQFPPPPGADGPPAQPAKPERTRVSRRALAIAGGLLAALGIGALAITVGPKVLGGDDAVPVVPATEVTLPSTVGDLVVVTDPQVGDGMRPLLGFGVRPAGVTVTSAYGIDPAGPLAMAAMATTIGEPADDLGQIAAWSQRTGSVVGEPVVGTGESQGVTCVTAAEAPSVPAGAFCVWTGSGMRGQTYSVAMSAEEAQALTTQLRSTTTNVAAAAPAQ